MRKILCISGVITVLFLSLLLTGWADADSGLNKALRQGNERYASAKYEEALKSYETGLETESENKMMNFNAGQAAYLLGDYEKASQYYEKAEDCVDKFLNAGNIFFRAGNAVEDANQKAQCYAQALQIYREGIIKYPQNVPLKYNYETVKALVDELLEEMDQEGEGDSGDQNDEQSEGESNEGQGESHNEESQSGQEQESEDTENAQEEQEQSSEQAGDSGDAQDESQEGGEGEQEAYSQDESEDEYDPDQEAIERILEMLENQEEESLKNNQGVVGGKDDTNGW